MKLREKFNLPPDFARQGFQDLAYPVWGSQQSGILATPTLTAVGPVYGADVYVKPSTAKKQLAADVTVTNPTGNGTAAGGRWEAIEDRGQVAKALRAKSVQVGPGKSETVQIAGDWADPHLWWPDDPFLYDLRTTVKVGGQPVDVRHTPFGFREW